jgi:hypothetical protein
MIYAAWQEAVERSKGREKVQRPKTQKATSPEHEDILDRTLKKRITTAANFVLPKVSRIKIKIKNSRSQ